MFDDKVNILLYNNLDRHGFCYANERANKYVRITFSRLKSIVPLEIKMRMSTISRKSCVVAAEILKVNNFILNLLPRVVYISSVSMKFYDICG